MTLIALALAAWFVLGLVLGPFIGRHLARCSAELDLVEGEVGES